jgi:hypothetical protein
MSSRFPGRDARASRFSGSDRQPVEKHGEEEPSGHRFLPWVIRQVSCLHGGEIQPVHQTGGYCWSTPSAENYTSHMSSLKAQKSREVNAVTAAVSRGNRMTNSVRALSVHLSGRMASTMRRRSGRWQTSAAASRGAFFSPLHRDFLSKPRLGVCCHACSSALLFSPFNTPP